MDTQKQGHKTFTDKPIIKFPQTPESEEFKQEVSSTYSSMSSSNFTMSCSGADEQDEKEPSTSGCSSFLAHGQHHQKAKKKERVKEYLKELKSIVQPTKGGHGRMGTLSTLQHVLTSMRKMKEGKQKSKIDKKFLPAPDTEDMSVLQSGLMHTVYESDSHESLTSESLKSNDELRIVLSASDHMVKSVSDNLKFVLGYPKDSWVGRSFVDYIHKKDLITFNSFHRSEWDADSCGHDEEEVKTESKIFYFRLRKFKGLGNSGFSLRKQDSHVPFQCMFTLKKMTEAELSKEGAYSSSWYEETSTSGQSGSLDVMAMETPSPPEVKQSQEAVQEKKLYTILYCVPLLSPYSGDVNQLPAVKTFETRHTLFCSYCHVQPNTIPLLGYLPQEMIGVSIFDFYHNDELKALHNIYQKVISLKGVPYRSNPIRLRAKNGSWITCTTEWSSFVNPWSKQLEFIIGKHTVIKGPENRNIYSEIFHMPTLEETPEPVLQARQKIKDLLLQPVETVYVGSSPEKVPVKGKGKTVAIIDQPQEIPKHKEPVSEVTKHDMLYQHDLEKPNLHKTGLIFKPASINRAYDQLNYTNCIKKFLLSQPRSFSSDSDVKKSSSDDGGETEEEEGRVKDVEKWLHNFDNIIPPSSIHMTSVDSRSLPALNDEYWKKTMIPSDTDFDFDISVPKPPSFGSSTKVLVSEQEHRDNENSLDPMGLREILQVPPASSHNTDMQPPSSPKSTTSSLSGEYPKVLTLTRDTLMKHTLLQEQLYLATASPDRNIVFISESQNPEKEVSKRQRQSLKRSHSPEQSSTERCKSGRHSEDHPSISTASVLNPSFPISPPYEESKSGENSPKSTGRVPVSVHILPIVTMCQPMTSSANGAYSGDQGMMTTHSIGGLQQLPYYVNDMSQMMVGFQQSSMLHTGLTSNSMPIPVQQLNSYIMQQASMEQTIYSSTLNRKKQEREKTKIQQCQSSTEESSTEDTTSSSLYLLESENKIKMAYHELVMQSLAQQMSPQGKGLNPAPWLESVCFTDNLQLKYHMPKTKHKRQLKKDREVIDKLVQPEMVYDQLDQLLSDLETCEVSLMDEEFDYMFFPSDEVTAGCACADLPPCRQCCIGDHGISEALKLLRKSNKKEKRSRKSVPESTSSSVSSMAVEMLNVKVDDSSKVREEPPEHDGEKMDIDLESNGSLTQVTQSVNVKSKPGSCSSKSDLGEGDIRCDVSSYSMNSLNACSDLTPSDQRSNHENGSSLKESDGDAMSKKSDSSSDKQQASSESESEGKSTFQKDVFMKLFTSLDICYPHLHKDNVPWLVDANFTDDVKMQYQLVIKDKEATLKSDRQKLKSFSEPALIKEQFSALMEDLREIDNPDQTLKDGDESAIAYNLVSDWNLESRRGEYESMEGLGEASEIEAPNENTFYNLFTTR